MTLFDACIQHYRRTGNEAALLALAMLFAEAHRA